MTDTRAKNHAFHEFVIRFIRIFAEPILRHKHCFIYDKAPEIDGNYMVVANHVTTSDPLLISLSFKRQMYFVASEHLMQKGFVSALLKWAVDPIIRLKSASAVSTVKEMLSALKSGLNICVFPEGTCTYDGNTGYMLPTIGKLAKSCKKPLVTYRFEGGFLHQPRWCIDSRKGPFRGRVVNIYTPEQLSQMSADGVNDIIKNDLDERTYERQRREMNIYRSDRAAEAIETSFYICPECGKVGGITSKGNSFGCECGMSATVDEYGFIHGMRFETPEEWDKWQTEELARTADSAEFSDAAVLYYVNDRHRRKTACRGRAHMDAQALDIGEYRFDISDISDMDLIRRNFLVFVSGGRHYELRGAEYFCARKYMQLFKTLRGEDV